MAGYDYADQHEKGRVRCVHCGDRRPQHNPPGEGCRVNDQHTWFNAMTLARARRGEWAKIPAGVRKILEKHRAAVEELGP